VIKRERVDQTLSPMRLMWSYPKGDSFAINASSGIMPRARIGERAIEVSAVEQHDCSGDDVERGGPGLLILVPTVAVLTNPQSAFPTEAPLHPRRVRNA